jgi:hypothetical protein
MIKTYTQLCHYRSFEERFNYLKLGGIVGEKTFGFDRYFNQVFYHSGEWKHVRDLVIIRDGGCDLGIADREIFSGLLVHHINPITMENIENGDNCIFDLNNLICCTNNTHQAIHYGDESLLVRLPKERRKGDTNLWSKQNR